MGPKKDVIDIVTELGGIKTAEAADKVFEERVDAAQLAKLNKIKNESVRQKIANAIVLCDPDKVFVDTASEEDRQFIKDLSLEKGEEKALPMENHTIHFDLKEEQGRIIDRTFYISNEGEEVNSLAKRMDRGEAYEDIKDKMTGIMKGKIMMIGFYLRGPVGAPASNPAVEISSSTYVMHSADILYRNVYADFDPEVEKLGHFLYQHSQRGPESGRRFAQCPGFYGSQPSDHLQLQLYLCRQHPVDEKRKPPICSRSRGV